MLRAELCDPRALLLAVEAPARLRAKLLQHDLRVADDADFSRAIMADLAPIDVDVDELASGEKRGARRKESIEFARAPITRITSASRNAVDRAAGNDR
jgi:hypothetical protein